MPLCFTEDETCRRSSLNPPSRNALTLHGRRARSLFQRPCGFGKTALAETLLRGQDVLRLSAGDKVLALPPADGRWRVLLLDDLQNMQDENDWNALRELIRSGSDRRFVLLSRGAPPGCLIAFRYSEMEKYYRALPKALR